jgi:alpha-tubulin suppressor-like RCC1 family protein
LTTVGGVQCWGRNYYGQLGDGTTSDSSVPVAVVGLGSGVAAIAANGSHTCAIISGGAHCWGNNSYGQLGDGSFTDSSVPVAVSGLGSGVAAIAAGGIHTCAVTSGGGAHCWGGNDYGQLGDRSAAWSSVPLAVSGLESGVADIAAGGRHSCVVTTGGGAWCWGSNETWQLGDGYSTFVTLPAVVVGFAAGVPALGPPALGLLAMVLTLTGALRRRSHPVSDNVG